jgi:hypothetical protein
MAAAVKLSQQLRTESCVVPGNGHCEAYPIAVVILSSVDGSCVAAIAVVLSIASSFLAVSW